ncbi:unnamed protein product [Medioppia subpectinata]|uniref:Uncharacterized protein n=1 Tax=Medioppia subpectinata TaxID=1979941 RepID=A0A7R9KAZ7_9ACAR|nr:unnamed protein product [Medioppia subpectinata]CAG2100097.1 unnamed protein product [Medioppia subpectinata]
MNVVLRFDAEPTTTTTWCRDPRDPNMLIALACALCVRAVAGLPPSHPPLPSYEFFFFAGLMIADMIVFAIMAYFYQPYEPFKDSDENNTAFNANEEKTPYLNGSADKELNTPTTQRNGKNGVSNDGFNEEDTKF